MNTTIQITGATTVHDVATIARYLSALPGASSVRVCPEWAIMEDQGLSEEQIFSAIEAAGNFKAHILPGKSATSNLLSLLHNWVDPSRPSTGDSKEIQLPVFPRAAIPARTFPIF